MSIFSFYRSLFLPRLVKIFHLTLPKVFNAVFIAIEVLLFKLIGISILLLFESLIFFVTELRSTQLLLALFEGSIVFYLLFLVIGGPNC